MRLNDDAPAGIFFIEQGGLLRITGKNGIGLLQQPAGTQQEPENFPPLPATGQFFKAFPYLLGQVEETAVNGDNQGHATAAGNECRHTAEPPERVGVDNGNTRLAPQGEGKFEGHKIAAHGDLLPPFCRRKTQYGQKGIETFDDAAGGRERVGGENIFDLGAKNYRADAMFVQSDEQPLKGGFRASPFGRIVFAQDMGDMHAGLSSNV
ncbi:MAG TPA: hypothetical protein VK815_00385 [Candidatus Acidoferrales bacterium]|nr:hypothetical protein [Candidatus Acidoferrales bacterium]